MLVAEISRAAYDYDNYKQIMGVIARRLQSEGENWRHVYKSLLLLEYMAKHGPQKVSRLKKVSRQATLQLSVNLISSVCDQQCTGAQKHKVVDQSPFDNLHWNGRQVVDELSSNISVIERLHRFEFKDKNAKDWGLNVRQRAKELSTLVSDPERIRRERNKASSNNPFYSVCLPPAESRKLLAK